MTRRGETAWRGYITNVTEVTIYRFYIHRVTLGVWLHG